MGAAYELFRAFASHPSLRIHDQLTRQLALSALIFLR
jgi:hypothetical protein